ncbi:MAG: DUF5615 family PIN-like protein [Acidobacteriota bacterium]
MSRLLADENFPLPVVIELRRLGYDIVTMQEIGKANQSIPDEEVLSLACADDRALLTINRKHFIRLHNSMPDHRGIIVCTFNPSFIEQASKIHMAIETNSELAGKLIRVNRG